MLSSRRVAVVTVAAAVFLTQAGAGFPVPLYPSYQDRWGLSAGQLSLLFTLLIVGVLASLAAVPRLTPVATPAGVLVLALGAGATAGLLFGYADDPALIFIASVLQGIAIGGVSALAPPLLVGLTTSEDAAVVGRVLTGATAVGLAAGPLLSGVLSEIAPLPGRLVFLLGTVGLGVLAVLVVTGRRLYRVEGRRPAPGAAGRPDRDDAFRRFYATGAVAFAAGGIVSSLGSLVAADRTGVAGATALGAVVTVFFTANAGSNVVLRRVPLRALTAVGLVVLACGLGLCCVAAAVGSYLLLVFGAVVAGLGQGSAIAASTSLTAAAAGAAGPRRTAAYFRWCYLGSALPGLFVIPLSTVLGLLGVFVALCGTTAGLAFALAVTRVDRRGLRGPGARVRPLVSTRSRRPGVVEPLPPAATRSGWTPALVAVDVDGTVVDGHGPISPRVVDAVQTASAAGAAVVLATGRSVDEVRDVMDALALPIGYAVCSNGAVLARYTPAMEIDETYRFDARPVVGRLREARPAALVAVEVPGEGYHVTQRFPPGEIHGPQRVMPLLEMDLAHATRVIFRDPSATVEDFLLLADRTDLGGLSFSIGYRAWLDLGPPGTSKGAMLGLVAGRLGVDPADVLAVGDGRNDLEMLQWAGRGVAMGNAPEEVRAFADDVTADVADDGLALELERWFPVRNPQP